MSCCQTTSDAPSKFEPCYPRLLKNQFASTRSRAASDFAKISARSKFAGIKLNWPADKFTEVEPLLISISPLVTATICIFFDFNKPFAPEFNFQASTLNNGSSDRKSVV